MKKKTPFIAVIALGLLAACLLAYFCWPRAAAETSGNGEKTLRGLAEMRTVITEHTQKNGAKAQSARKRRRRGGGALTLSSLMFDDLPASERALCEAVQEALDAEDFQKTIEAASKLMSSKIPAVRSHAVDALGWFGAEALPELTPLMGDPDEDVAQSAINAWESGMSEIDDAQVRFKVAGMALGALSNEDALQSISSQYSIAATELIDSAEGEEAELEMRVMVIQSVVDMIDSSNSRLSDLGRELYEDITGNEWLNVTEAETYLADPDNYETPEDRDEGVTSSAEIHPEDEVTETEDEVTETEDEVAEMEDEVAETTDGSVSEDDGYVDSEVDPAQ